MFCPHSWTSTCGDWLGGFSTVSISNVVIRPAGYRVKFASLFQPRIARTRRHVPNLDFSPNGAGSEPASPRDRSGTTPVAVGCVLLEPGEVDVPLVHWRGTPPPQPRCCTQAINIFQSVTRQGRPNDFSARLRSFAPSDARAM